MLRVTAELQQHLDRIAQEQHVSIAPTIGNAKWWAKRIGVFVSLVTLASTAGLTFWREFRPPEKVLVHSTSCEDKISKLERKVELNAVAARAHEDWIASVLEEDDFDVVRNSTDRLIPKIKVERPNARAIRPMIVIQTPQPVTP